jgi:tripartite-type tricarboxylate transporter receptor subunit TctC
MMQLKLPNYFFQADKLASLICIVVLSCFAIVSFAQNYPSRPIKIVVPYPAGAVGDTMIRIVTQRLSEKYKQGFVIDNKSGGGGMAAAEGVAGSPADGYVLLFNGPNHVTNLGLYKKVPYDPVHDFEAISYVAYSQTILVVHPKTGIKTVQQLIDAAKKNPMVLNYGSSGNGTGSALKMQMLMRVTGIQMTHIPYRGSSQAIVAQASGEIDAFFASTPVALELIRSGKLIPLMVNGTQRYPGLPDVPTSKELALQDSDVEVWFGLFSPKKTPQTVVKMLSDDIQRVLKEPAVAEKFSIVGLTVVGSNSADFDSFVRSEAIRWPKLIQEFGIKAE